MAKSKAALLPAKAAAADEVIGQNFKLRVETYEKVRLLAAARKNTGKAATGQAIYEDAVEEYLDRHDAELKAAAGRV